MNIILALSHDNMNTKALMGKLYGHIYSNDLEIGHTKHFNCVSPDTNVISKIPFIVGFNVRQKVANIMCRYAMEFLTINGIKEKLREYGYKYQYFDNVIDYVKGSDVMFEPEMYKVVKAWLYISLHGRFYTDIILGMTKATPMSIVDKYKSGNEIEDVFDEIKFHKKQTYHTKNCFILTDITSISMVKKLKVLAANDFVVYHMHVRNPFCLNPTISSEETYKLINESDHCLFQSQISDFGINIDIFKG